jgi:hypothetical protein
VTATYTEHRRVSGLCADAVEPRPGSACDAGRNELNHQTRLAQRVEIDNHELRPVLGRMFALEDGARAFEAKAAGGIAGKVALKVNADRSWVQQAGPVAR